MSVIKVSNLSDEFAWGSRVEGVTADNVGDAGVRTMLNDLFEDRGLIVFRGCETSQEMLLAISSVFGELKDHPTKSTARVDQEAAIGVIDMVSPALPDDDDTGKVFLNGKKIKGFAPWHFDHCYNDELNRAGVLRNLQNAPQGGRTGFVDGIELYQQIAPELRDRVEGLNIIYTLDIRLSQMRFGRPEGFFTFPEGAKSEANVREAMTFPRAMHPAVWTRATGEKVLHVGPWMSVGIENHEDREGEALFERLCQEINHKVHAYWHDWEATDMLIWDNWRMIHAVEGHDPQYRRQAQRTTIKGDYGLGYFEDGKKIGEVFRELVM
jgi:taurine dioxygenase